MSGSSVPSFAKWSTRSLDDHGMQPASTWGNWEFLLLVENSAAQQYQLGRFVFIKNVTSFVWIWDGINRVVGPVVK